MTNRQRIYWETHPDLVNKTRDKEAQEIQAEDNKVEEKKGEEAYDSTSEPVLAQKRAGKTQ